MYDKVATRRMNKSLCTMWIYKLGQAKNKLEDKKLLEGPKKVEQQDTTPSSQGITNRFHGANLPDKVDDPKEDEKKSASEIQPPLNKVENYRWVPIVQYAWDQPPFRVKLTIKENMKGVGLIDKSNITCEFTDHSIDLKVRNLNGKHYRLNITRTHQPI